jgi:hypothetical protein
MRRGAPVYCIRMEKSWDKQKGVAMMPIKPCKFMGKQ